MRKPLDMAHPETELTCVWRLEGKLPASKTQWQQSQERESSIKKGRKFYKNKRATGLGTGIYYTVMEHSHRTYSRCWDKSPGPGDKDISGLEQVAGNILFNSKRIITLCLCICNCLIYMYIPYIVLFLSFCSSLKAFLLVWNSQNLVSLPMPCTSIQASW